MIKLVSLNRTRERRIEAERTSVRARLVNSARDIDDGIDGYAIVAFKRKGDGEMRIWADFMVRDAADKYLLPEMARVQITRFISRKSDEPER